MQAWKISDETHTKQKEPKSHKGVGLLSRQCLIYASNAGADLSRCLLSRELLEKSSSGSICVNVIQDYLTRLIEFADSGYQLSKAYPPSGPFNLSCGKLSHLFINAAIISKNILRICQLVTVLRRQLPDSNCQFGFSHVAQVMQPTCRIAGKGPARDDLRTNMILRSGTRAWNLLDVLRIFCINTCVGWLCLQPSYVLSVILALDIGRQK